LRAGVTSGGAAADSFYRMVAQHHGIALEAARAAAVSDRTR